MLAKGRGQDSNNSVQCSHASKSGNLADLVVYNWPVLLNPLRPKDGLTVLILPSKEFWLDLWNSARGEIIGGLAVTLILGVTAIFWKTIVSGLKTLLPATPSPPLVPPQPVAPQPVVIRVEGVQTAPPPVAIPESTGAKRRSYIPRPPLAGFVARRDENNHDIVERLKVELSPEKEQLIVLWGAGGVGKTTLAAETARAMRDLFSGGVVWTTADGKPDYGLSTLLDEIAGHLDRPDLRQLAPDVKDEQVHSALSTARAILIVVDNFETISPAEQEKCSAWLANRAFCPALITSRDQVPRARPVHILAMSLEEAREFLERLISDARKPSAFDHLNRDQIIDAADRIPLVMQWVVRQVESAREPQAVLNELALGEGDAAKRVFDQSFDLPQLGDDGRSVLLALSLFVPSASRSALCEVSGFGSDLARLDRSIQQLTELWLIEATASNERLRIEGLTRELAKARLSKSESISDYTKRFITYFLNLAQAHSANQPDDYKALEQEKDNILKAMDVAFEMEEWESVQKCANIVSRPVGGLLSVRGFWTDAIKAIQQALDAARHSNSQRGIAVFAQHLALMYWYRGELQNLSPLMEESVAILKGLGDQIGIVQSLHTLALIATRQDDVIEARRLYNEGLELAISIGERQGIADIKNQLANINYREGKIEEARELYEQSLGINKELENEPAIAISLHQLGCVARDQGDFKKARKLLNESLEIKRKRRDEYSVAYTLWGLGLLEEREQKLTEATRLFAESLSIFGKLNAFEVGSVRKELERVNAKLSGKVK